MKLLRLFLSSSFFTLLMISNISADETLPLTPKQISRLQALVSSDNQVFNFENAPHEHVVWQQAPIDVTLPVGRERMVSFPSAVAFGYDKSTLPDTALGVQNNNGTLYLSAKKAFPVERVQVKLNDTGQIILLNLSAEKEASDTPLDIVLATPPNLSTTNTPIPPTTTATQNTGLTDDTVSYLSLTRFAVQQLYAPKRLLVQPPDIFRTPMHTTKTVTLLLDGSVIAMPLASWRGGDLFVTTVLMRNQLKQPLTLDPRNLCGNWRAASFFPETVLAPSGQMQDSTTLFLVSNRPFADSLQACTRGF